MDQFFEPGSILPFVEVAKESNYPRQFFAMTMGQEYLIRADFQTQDRFFGQSTHRTQFVAAEMFAVVQEEYIPNPEALTSRL